jgi:hypothetical protein
MIDITTNKVLYLTVQTDVYIEMECLKVEAII